MAKKTIPAIIFNNDAYKYPKGLRVTNEAELEERLSSGEWNTGPVDQAKSPVKQRPLSHMNVNELTERAAGIGLVVDETLTRKELIQKIKDKEAE